jgi:hypothetical protein
MSKYRFPVIPLDVLDAEVREALERYTRGLARRSRMRWRIERVSKPGTKYRALLVGRGGVGVRVHYSQAPAEPRPRWKAEMTRHVVSPRRSGDMENEKTRRARG